MNATVSATPAAGFNLTFSAGLLALMLLAAVEITRYVHEDD